MTVHTCSPYCTRKPCMERKATEHARVLHANRLQAEEIKKLKDQFVEAVALMGEMNAHEGAEGWSKDLSERLDAFYKKLRGEECPNCAGDKTQPHQRCILR